MTNKAKGQQYSLYVQEIQNAYKMSKGNKYIHLITFRDAEGIYVAEEVEDASMSKFVKNRRNIFEVTNPGRPGFPDWIRFVTSDVSVNGNGHEQQQQAPPASRDDMIIAQTAFNKAVELGIKHDWSNDTIIDNAYMFAGNIKLIAKQLAAELL